MAVHDEEVVRDFMPNVEITSLRQAKRILRLKRVGSRKLTNIGIPTVEGFSHKVFISY